MKLKRTIFFVLYLIARIWRTIYYMIEIRNYQPNDINTFATKWNSNTFKILIFIPWIVQIFLIIATVVQQCTIKKCKDMEKAYQNQFALILGSFIVLIFEIFFETVA